MDRRITEDLVKQTLSRRNPLARIRMVNGDVVINQRLYQIIMDRYHSFDIKALQDRYNPVDSKFDFLLGDWSYDQLRITGFYSPHRRVAKELKINYLQDYLMEYCNFGSPYFVLRKMGFLRHHKRSDGK